MLGFIAVREAAAIASGHGSALMRPIGAGTLDGFAAGMLLSGVVLLVIMTRRRGERGTRGRAALAPFSGGYGEPPRYPAVLRPYGDAEREMVLQPGVQLSDWLAAETNPKVAEQEAQASAGPVIDGQHRRPAGHRSKHRLAAPEDGGELADTKFRESHRRAPRHAAPSSSRSGAKPRRPGVIGKVAGLMQVRLLAGH
jgi:hypothetical protein